MPEETDNPAKRLHEFMTRCQSARGSTRAVLAELFGVQDDLAPIFRGLADMSDMAEEVLAALKSEGHYRAAKTYAEHLPPIKSFFAVENLAASWDQHKQHRLRDADISLLKAYGSILSGFPSVGENDLDELRKQSESLYEDISVAEIDEDLKRVLLDSLQRVKQAIHDYRLWGTAGIQKALQNLIGALAVHSTKIAEEAKSTDHAARNNWLAKLIALTNTLGALVKAKNSVQPAIEWVFREGGRFFSK